MDAATAVRIDYTPAVGDRVAWLGIMSRHFPASCYIGTVRGLAEHEGERAVEVAWDDGVVSSESVDRIGPLHGGR